MNLHNNITSILSRFFGDSSIAKSVLKPITLQKKSFDSYAFGTGGSVVIDGESLDTKCVKVKEDHSKRMIKIAVQSTDLENPNVYTDVIYDRTRYRIGEWKDEEYITYFTLHRMTPDGVEIPEITGQVEEVRNINGSNITIGPITASGDPAPDFFWEAEVTPGAEDWSTDLTTIFEGRASGENTNTLTINSITSNDTRAVRCIAYNNEGAAYSNPIQIIVEYVPAFVVMPNNITGEDGEIVTCGPVSANGYPVPTYQWEVETENGNNIWSTDIATIFDGRASGENTDTLTWTASYLDDRRIRCVATNSAGTDISNIAQITINLAPMMMSQTNEYVGLEGETAAFSVAALGKPTPTYHWEAEATHNSGDYTTDLDTVFEGRASGVSTSNLSIANTEDNDDRFIIAVATNEVGTDTSNPAQLLIHVLPSFTLQPVSVTDWTGETAVFTVNVAGSPTPTIHWEAETVNGNDTWSTDLTLIFGGRASGANTDTLTITGLMDADDRGIRAVATNAAGFTPSNEVQLTADVQLFPPSWSTHPLPVSETEGNSAVFGPVTATGVPTPTYHWQAETVNGNDTWSSDLTTIFGGRASGETTNTLTISSTVDADDRGIRAVATNSEGVVNSNEVQLTINIDLVAPSFTAQPSAVTDNEGSGVSFGPVSATGTPTPTYQWEAETANGNDTWSTDLATIFGGRASGVTSNTLSIASTVDTDDRKVRCIATNAAGTDTSNAVQLTINVAPSFTVDPVAQTDTEGTTITFGPVTATGTPTPTYQWEAETADGNGIWSTDLATIFGGRASGDTSNTLSISSVVDADDRRVRCVATNAAGSDTSAVAQMTVNVVPSFTIQPTAQTEDEGTTATFGPVTATGTPTPTYQWQAEATNGGADWTSDLATVFGGRASGETTNTLTISSPVDSDDRGIRCIATNIEGSDTSDEVQLTINVVLIAPSFTSHPSGVTDTEGNTAIFGAVSATGVPTPTYHWEVEATDGGADWTSNLASIFGGRESGENTDTLTITGLVDTDDRRVRAIATNSQGTDTSTLAQLTVNKIPVITGQPSNATKFEGENVTFGPVTATGTPGPSFHWEVNNGGWTTNLAGAFSGTVSGESTDTLSINGLGINDDYDLRCVATNVAGTDTSNTVTLTVNAALVGPTFTVDPTLVTQLVGTTATFGPVTATGNPTPTYHWEAELNDGNSDWSTDLTTIFGGRASGASTDTLTITSTVGTDDRRVRAVATNSEDSAISATAQLTINAVPAITGQPVSDSVYTGDNATFGPVTASGDPTPTYHWEVDTTGGGNWSTNLAGTFTASVSGENTDTLTLTNVAIDDDYNLRCIATNVAGTDTTNVVSITVEAPLVAPSFTVHPDPFTGEVGDTAIFGPVLATGNPTPDYTWEAETVNGNDTYSTDLATIFGGRASGENTDTLTIINTEDADDRKVRAVASNTEGQAQSAMQLTIDPPAPIEEFVQDFTGSTIGNFVHIRSGSATAPNTSDNLVTYTTNQPAWYKNLGLQLEASAANLYPNSADVASWSNVLNVNVATTGATGTRGVATDDVTGTGGKNKHPEVSEDVSVTSGTVYTLTHVMDPAGYDWVQFEGYTGFTGWRNVNLATGATGNGSGFTITTEVLSNGWVKITLTSTATATGTGTIRINIVDSDVTEAYPRWTANAGDGFIHDYGQFEAGSYPTSYFETSGAPGTRQDAICSATFTQLGTPLPSTGLGGDVSGQIKLSIPNTWASILNGACILDIASAGGGSSAKLTKVDSTTVRFTVSGLNGEVDRSVDGTISSSATSADLKFRKGSAGIAIWVDGSITEVANGTADFNNNILEVNVMSDNSDANIANGVVGKVRIATGAKSNSEILAWI